MRTAVRYRLQTVNGSIEASGRLLKQYINDLCNKSKNDLLSTSYKLLITAATQQPCPFSDYCCVNDQSNGCENQESVQCIEKALVAMWNNGPKITGVDNIKTNSRNAYQHMISVGLLHGLFKGICQP